MPSAEFQKISGLLKKYRWRIRLHDGWLLAQETFWGALLLILLSQIAGRIWPIKNIDLISISILGTWLIFVLSFSLFKPLTTLRTAWRVDASLAIKEKISSAILFENMLAPNSSINEKTRDLIGLQRADALKTLNHSSPKQAFRLQWLKRPLLYAAGLLVLIFGSIYFPNPMDAVLAERAEVAAAAEAEAERIEDLRDEIEESEELSEEEREELLRELEALAEQLRENPGDRAEALAALSETEESLQERLDPNADLRQAALDSLEARLNSLAQQLAEMENAENSSIEEALDALLDEMGEMDQSELDSLAQSLQQLAAQAAQAGDTSLAEALSALSQAAQSGEISEAESAAGDVSEAAEQAAEELSDQEALEQALSQLQESRQSLSQSSQTASSGQPGQPSSGQSSSGQNSQGQQGSPGQQGSQGQSTGSGGGTNADSLPPNTGSGQAGSPQGQAQNAQAGSLDEQVYVPWERLEGDEELTISGQDTGQGHDQISESDTPLPGTSDNITVPYQDVFSSYLDSAYETIDQSYIPSGLKDYVLEYFSQLEPDN